MNKKFLKISGLVCLICILMISTLSACSNDNDNGGFYYDVESYIQTIRNSSDFAQRIDSYSEFTKLCDEKGVSIYDEKDWNYDSELYKKLREYNKGFFRSKALIIVYIEKPHPFGLKFGNLTVKDDRLIVNILSEYNPYDNSVHYPDATEDYVYLIEINKSLIGDRNQIIVKEYNNLN